MNPLSGKIAYLRNQVNNKNFLSQIKRKPLFFLKCMRVFNSHKYKNV